VAQVNVVLSHGRFVQMIKTNVPTVLFDLGLTTRYLNPDDHDFFNYAFLLTLIYMNIFSRLTTDSKEHNLSCEVISHLTSEDIPRLL